MIHATTSRFVRRRVAWLSVIRCIIGRTEGWIMDGWERRGAVIRHARESGDDVAAATDGVKETTTRDGQAEREWQALHR